MFKRLILLSAIISYQAGASDSLSYSGRLVNGNGSPVTGPVNLKFDFAYTNATTSILCSEQIPSVALTNGVFHVKLDPDCSPSTLMNVLNQVPVGEALAIRVTDESHTKAYSFQALHSMPASIVSSMSKQLVQMGATPGQFLKWDGAKWTPSNESGTGNGTVTSVATGTGLTGGPITTSGTISIANGGVDTAQLADASVTDLKVASGITRSKLSNGTAHAVLVNSAAGVMSEVAQVSIAQGGTGANSASGARTNLGLGSAAVANVGFGAGSVMAGDSVPICLANQKLQMNAGPIYWSCALDNDSLDNTKLPLDGSVAMTGALDMDSHKIIDLTSPTDPGDAANKAYVDAQVGGLTSSQWSTNTTKIYYNTGMVGIGTNNPTRLLHVYGSGDSKAVMESSDGGAAGLLFKNNQGDVGLGIGSDENFHIGSDATNPGASSWLSILSTNGNVGIANLSPSEKLDVTGNAAVSGNVLVSGKVRLKSDNANYVELQAPASLSATLNFKFPGTSGASGNALVTDGSGNLSWAAVATGASSVGGDLSGTISNAQIVAGVVTDAEVAAGAGIAQSKIANLTSDLSGKEPSIANGTSSQYYRGDKTWQTLNTNAVAEGTNLYFTEPRVLGTDLVGYTATTGAVSASDTVLTAIEKLDGNIGALSAAATTSFVNVAGDTMTGDLILNADPSAALGAATKQYVDSQITGTTYWSKNVNNLSYTNGYVGIGTSTPTSPLDIRTAATAPMALTRYSDTAVQGTGIIYNRTRGTQAAPTVVQSGDKLSTIANVFGYDGDSYVTAAGINVAVDGTPGDGDMPGRIEFIVQKDNQGSIVDSITPAMVIKNSGNIGIGTTSPSQLLHINSASAGVTTLIQTGSNGAVSQARFTGATDGGTARSWGTGLNIVDGTGAFDIYDYTAGSSRLNIDTTGNVSLTGTLKLKSDNANYVVLRAPASLASTQTLTWPGTSGSAGNALTTDGAGNLAWSAVATTASSVGGDLTGTIANAQIAAGTITDADISSTAAIAQSKISGLTTSLSGKEPTIAAGTTAQYWRGDKSWQTLNTSAVPEGANLYFLDSRVRAALMSGYSVGTALPLAATDTLIEAIGKLEAQIIANDTAFDNSGIWSKNGSSLFYNSGGVGVGTNNPLFKFHIADGNLFSTHVASNTGVYFGAHSSGYGIIQATDATNTAVKNLVLQQYGGFTGIGTNTPSTTLEVKGSEISSIKSVSSNAESRIRIISTAPVSTANAASIDLAVNSSTQERTAALITAQYTDTTDATRTSRLDLKPYTNGGSVTTMSLHGPNVGIGTTTPLEKFVVGDHAVVAHDGGSKVIGFNTEYDPTIFWNAKSGGAFWGVLDFSPSSGNFVVASGSSNGNTSSNAKLSVTGAGSVGVGLSSPTVPFHVQNNSSTGGIITSLFLQPNQPAGSSTYLKLGQSNAVVYNAADIAFHYAGNNSNLNRLDFGFQGIAPNMVVRADGNVGIGTSAPQYTLDINGSTRQTGAASFENQTNTANGPTFSFWKHRNYANTQAGDDIGFLSFYGYDGGLRRGGYIAARQESVSAGSVPTYLMFATAASGNSDGVERMRISASGNVGIGTTNPNKPLTVVGGANTGIRVEGTSGNTHLDFTVGGVVKTNFYWDMANNFAVLNGSGSDLIMNGGSGNVGIGTTAPGYKLHVIGDINASGSVRAAGVALTSDKRFKKDIKPISGALEKILSINGIGYNWNREKYPERNFVERHQIGVIAQEVEKVFPELVDTDKNGYKSVNYPALVAPLIESTKVLNAKNIEQSREIASLKEENAVMKARLERLEKILLNSKASR